MSTKQQTDGWTGFLAFLALVAGVHFFEDEARYALKHVCPIVIKPFASDVRCEVHD